MGGTGRVMFGTDYPHPTDMPFLLGLIDDLPADQAAAVRGANARHLFAL